ncbi:MAG: glycoside hydrolase family 2 [Muribaculaceae bacterium]|nr:glycoside hydrolase family 2 [Muribaculaceae bacterium]
MAACMSLAAGALTPEGWRLYHSGGVTSPDSAVSAVGFDDSSWHHVTVPSTVLNALVCDGVYPDPRVGMNNYLIPDVSDEFNARLGLDKYNHLADGSNPWQQPWWYRVEFKVPSAWRGKLVWLNLDGINYRADVWVNGHRVADRDSVVGMFRRFRFDVTPYIKPGRDNAVAIKIYQVDHPGDPSPGTQFTLFGPNRGNAGDIHRDETLKMSGGWDCAPVVRDRNMGIYLPVTLEATGPVTFDDPHVVTELPGRDTTLARVTVTVPLVNNTGRDVRGTLTARISSLPEIDFITYKKKVSTLISPITIKRDVTIGAGDTTTVTLTPDEYESLSIVNPPLWYPNGYGSQPLQHLELVFKPRGGAESRFGCDFGLRQVETRLMEREYESHLGKDVEHGLVFIVNGVEVFSRGGWIQPDILLDNSTRNIYDQVRLMAELGANTIGSEDMPTPDDAWLAACDKYGLMWWHVFHQCYRMFPGRANQNNPDDHALAAAHVRDQIKRYRNHPAIVTWVGVNEVCPARDLYIATREAARTLDPSRPFIPTTSTSWDVEKLTPWLAEDMPIGTTDDGAPDYNWAPSDYYFDKIDEVYTQMFKNELGMPAPPVYESIEKFIPTINKPFDVGDRLWPLDSVWAEHGAWCVNNFVYRGFDNAVRTLYSDPESARDYVLKSQLLSADGYRAMIEAANHRAWDITTGVMLWKLNSCWPDVAWQVYDWYLTPNAAYYFTRKAMEPVHAQLNANTESLTVVNNTQRPTGPLVLETRIHDFSMKQQWSRRDTVSLGPNSYVGLPAIPRGQKLAAVYLVTLSLTDADGNEVSHNTYWRYSQHQNFYWLLRLPQGNLTREVTAVRDGDEWLVTVKLACDDAGCAFFKHLTIGDTPVGPSVNPVFWSDNFITLLPGETRTVTARVAADMLEGAPTVRIE